ncbi:MAG: tRNA pseudouridine(55) synthase TruB [Candidatus Methylacidiphilales bacterium]|nr:tRNA pseudouridine(55) synthase TruB [Candidatus Methylacidiphilales bacterium]
MNPPLPSIDGLLMVNKPGGMTSHDVVDFVRRRFGLKKVGHCGTLDPMATGLLMLVIGKATKVQDLLMSEDKEYRGTLKLGTITDSQDAEGQALETRPVEDYDEATLRAAFAAFQGDFYQTPPMVSAVKKDGVPLYKLARQGKVVEREPRLVTVYRHSLDRIALPEIDFTLRCSKGFYVRSYCHEIGLKLGCGGHLSALSRTRSGNFSLEQALGWPAMQDMRDLAQLVPYVISLPEISRIRRQ